MLTRATNLLVVGVVEGRDGVVVTPSGNAGHREAEALAEALARVMTLRPRRVTLDLSRLDSVSSVAAGVLMSFQHALLRRGARVTVCRGGTGGRHPAEVCHART